jgi:hypothetical protein
VCEITGELAYRPCYTQPLKKENVLCYKTDFIYENEDICPMPHQVIPITPPNAEEDVHNYVPAVNIVKEKELV